MDFLHAITVGVNQVPTNAVTTTVNKVAIYSAGIGGGNALKIAVKYPNFVKVLLLVFQIPYEKGLIYYQK